MTRTGDENHAGAVLPDYPIAVDVYEVEARCCSPVAQQPRFDVSCMERFAQKRVIAQIDLSHRQVVRRPPIRVDLV